MKVTIMSGIPGSGKSTIAKALASAEVVLVVSADHFFEELGRFDPVLLGTAHARCFARYLVTLEKGGVDRLVVDNTNLSAWEISPYVLAADAHNVESTILRVDCEPEVAFALQAHGVPRQAFDRMVLAYRKRDVLPFWSVEHWEAGLTH